MSCQMCEDPPKEGPLWRGVGICCSGVLLAYAHINNTALCEQHLSRVYSCYFHWDP